jgi:hypothetical protein
MAIDNWQPVPLWVLLVLLVVVRISFLSNRRLFMDLGKKSKEKYRSFSNLTGTPHVAVPYLFVELRASGRSSRPPTPRRPQGCRGRVLGLHQVATVDGGMKR